MWDTAGEERFRSLTPLYYKDAQAILVSFSLTSFESFENLGKWLKEIDQNCQTNNYVLCIVGTMLDLDDQKEVPFKEGQKFARQNQAQYFETSSKDGTNINEMIQLIGNELTRIDQTIGFDHKKAEKLNKPKKGGKKNKKKGGSSCC